MIHEINVQIKNSKNLFNFPFVYNKYSISKVLIKLEHDKCLIYFISGMSLHCLPLANFYKFLNMNERISSITFYYSISIQTSWQTLMY